MAALTRLKSLIYVNDSVIMSGPWPGWPKKERRDVCMLSDHKPLILTLPFSTGVTEPPATSSPRRSYGRSQFPPLPHLQQLSRRPPYLICAEMHLICLQTGPLCGADLELSICIRGQSHRIRVQNGLYTSLQLPGRAAGCHDLDTRSKLVMSGLLLAAVLWVRCNRKLCVGLNVMH